MIDFNEIYVFVKVVEAGSFVGASKQLGMPSTTVSRKVQKLEEALGVRLLQRSTRKLYLTDVGQQYFERCQQSLVGLEEATTMASQARSMPSGVLRITSPMDFAVNYLQPWVDDFLRTYPEVNIELEVADRYVDLLDERIDIAFRSGELEDSSLVARRIGPKQSILCASPDYLARAGQPGAAEDLIQHDCVIMGTSLANQHWRLRTEGGEVKVSVKGRYAVDNMQLVVNALVSSMGIALVPYPLVHALLKKGELVQVLKGCEPAVQSIYVVYPSHKQLASHVRAFIDYVVEQTTPQAPWEKV